MEKTKKIIGGLALALLGVGATVVGYKKVKGKDEAEVIDLTNSVDEEEFDDEK